MSINDKVMQRDCEAYFLQEQGNWKARIEREIRLIEVEAPLFAPILRDHLVDCYRTPITLDVLRALDLLVTSLRINIEAQRGK